MNTTEPKCVERKENQTKCTNNKLLYVMTCAFAIDLIGRERLIKS